MLWLAGDVKEPIRLSKRVGHEVPGLVVWPLLLHVVANHNIEDTGDGAYGLLEPTRLSKRVGNGVPGLVVWPLLLH